MGPLAIILISVAASLLLLFLLFLFLIKPRKRRAAVEEFKECRFAHRGLHGEGAAENSLTAFRLAVEAGYGIELDVRMSADGKIFVFHDETLTRMCGINKKISDMSYSQLRSLYLKGGRERIPLLTEVLELVEGRVPLLIEIKSADNERLLCKRLCAILDTYSGAFAIQSFDPRILGYFKKYRPRFARGQLVANMKIQKGKENPSKQGPFIRFALTHMLTNIISRPDFISIKGTHLNEPAFWLATRIFRCKGFVWTVKDKRQYMLCRQKGLYSIFENIRPQ